MLAFTSAGGALSTCIKLYRAASQRETREGATFCSSLIEILGLMQNRPNLAIAVSLHRNSHTHSQPTSLVGNTTKVKLARSPVPGTWEIPSLEPSGGGGGT